MKVTFLCLKCNEYFDREDICDTVSWGQICKYCLSVEIKKELEADRRLDKEKGVGDLTLK